MIRAQRMPAAPILAALAAYLGWGK